MDTVRIAVGTDHAGHEPENPYAPELIAHLGVRGYDVINCGTDTSAPVDYPDVAERVCDKILHHEADCGLLICGSGIGMAMTANRHRGIRAANCVTEQMARLAREHNHANILCVGTRLLSLEDCKKVIDAFLETTVSEEGRHKRRVEKMDEAGGAVAR